VLNNASTPPIGRDPADNRRNGPTLAQNATSATAALFARRVFDGRWLQIELREQPLVTNPLNGREVQSPPIAVLWQSGLPLAMLVGNVLAVSRTAPRFARDLLVAEARMRNLPFVQVREVQLWQLLPVPSA
jgi:hypothetical protein